MLLTKKDDNCFELKGNDAEKVDQVAYALIDSDCDKSGIHANLTGHMPRIASVCCEPK